MNWIIWTLIGIGILATLLFATGYWRYVLTGYLIARVTPYEQPGGGAGSILVLGDSTGYGTGASRASESIAGRLGNDYPGYSIKNNSVNGRKINEALDQARKLEESDRYDLVVLQIAANDMIAGRSASDTVADMKTLVDEVRDHAQSIVIISAGNIGATPRFTGEEAKEMTATSLQYTQMMLQYTSDQPNVAYVSLFDEPEDDPFVQEPGTYSSIDGLHPTSAGYAIWYQKAKPYFDVVLERR